MTGGGALARVAKQQRRRPRAYAIALVRPENRSGHEGAGAEAYPRQPEPRSWPACFAGPANRLSATRGVLDPSLVVSVGPKDPLSLRGVYEPPRAARRIHGPAFARREGSLGQDRLSPEIRHLRVSPRHRPGRRRHGRPERPAFLLARARGRAAAGPSGPRFDATRGLSRGIARDAQFANLAHRRVPGRSVVAITGLKHLLSLGGVYARPPATGAMREPRIHAARGLAAAIGSALLFARCASAGIASCGRAAG